MHFDQTRVSKYRHLLAACAMFEVVGQFLRWVVQHEHDGADALSTCSAFTHDDDALALAESQKPSTRKSYSPAEGRSEIVEAQHAVLTSIVWRRLLRQDLLGAADALSILLRFFSWDFPSIAQVSITLIARAGAEPVSPYYKKFLSLSRISHKCFPRLAADMALALFSGAARLCAARVPRWRTCSWLVFAGCVYWQRSAD
jgi:hypothetical protein